MKNFVGLRDKPYYVTLIFIVCISLLIGNAICLWFRSGTAHGIETQAYRFYGLHSDRLRVKRASHA